MFNKRPRKTKEQKEMNNSVTEMKNTLEASISSIPEAEEWLNELKEWWKPLLQNRIKKKIIKRNEDILKVWDKVKCTNIHIYMSFRRKRERKMNINS